METQNSDDEKFKYTYENCWKFIIRPPRDNYALSELNLDEIILDSKETCIREDYEIKSKRGFLMQCSFYRIDPKKRDPLIRPVVIYLHGNSSCRVEGKKMAIYLLNKGIDLFVFDFPGCGKSEGEYISLGYHEKDDVRIIVDYVASLPGVGNIGLWGRSMGAATTLLYSDERIKAQCVDSPFADFRELAIILCKKEINIPEFIINTVLYFIKKTLKSKNDMDIDELKPIEYVEKSKTPTFFIHAMKDELIPYKHTINMFEKYGGIKFTNIVEGSHNTPRPKHIIYKIVNFFDKYLRKKSDNDDQNDECEEEEENENNEEEEEDEDVNIINENKNYK